MNINFDTYLYSISAVKKAIKDYHNLADFSFRKQKNLIKVTIKNIKESNLKTLFKQEFSNYVLYLTGKLKSSN